MKRFRVHEVDEFQSSVDDLTCEVPKRRPVAWILALSCFLLAGVWYRCQEARAQLPTIEWTDTAEGPAVAPAEAVVDYSSWVCEQPPHIEPPLPSAFGLLILDPPTLQERKEIERAILGCAWTNTKIADPFVALALRRLEAEAEAPYGLLLSVWCLESAMRTKSARGQRIRGDWVAGEPTSFGPFQLQLPFISVCGGTRDKADDPIWAAGCYLSRVLHVLRKVDCPDPWRVAEARVANTRRYLWQGCKAESKHWKILKTWQ